jgi:acetyl esterase/lipase
MMLTSMPSLQARLATIVLRRQFAGWSDGTVAQQRAWQARSTRYLPLPKQVRCQPVDVDGIPAAWIETGDPSLGVVLYLHGGAYSLGSVVTHRELIARLARATRRRALAINYRLAPESPFPAALDDTVAAYRWLLAQGISPERIVIAGDSAGGGLAIAALVVLRDARTPLPAAAVCLSPWLDLTLSGASVRTQATADPILDAASLDRYARAYAAGQPLNHPLLSPLFADLRGLPPVLLQAGSAEILFDDATRLTAAARATGVAVTLQTWEGLFHVFQMFSFLPETAKAVAQVTEFVASLPEPA